MLLLWFGVRDNWRCCWWLSCDGRGVRNWPCFDWAGVNASCWLFDWYFIGWYGDRGVLGVRAGNVLLVLFGKLLWRLCFSWCLPPCGWGFGLSANRFIISMATYNRTWQCFLLIYIFNEINVATRTLYVSLSITFSMTFFFSAFKLLNLAEFLFNFVWKNQATSRFKNNILKSKIKISKLLVEYFFDIFLSVLTWMEI